MLCGMNLLYYSSSHSSNEYSNAKIKAALNHLGLQGTLVISFIAQVRQAH